MDGDALRESGAVLLVFALLGAALWAFRRAGWYHPGGKAALLGGSRSARTLESLERMALTREHSVHLVEADGRRFLLAAHPRGCTLLADLSDTPLKVAAGIKKDPAQSGGAAA